MKARYIARFGIVLLLAMSVMDEAHAEDVKGNGHETGIFRAELRDRRVLFGFDEAAFGRDMVASVLGRSVHTNHQLIRWQRDQDGLVLRSTLPGREHESQPNWLDDAVVIAHFPAIACGSLTAAVCIDATQLFTPGSAPAGWTLAEQATSLVAESAVTFPGNVVVGAAAPGAGEPKEWKKWSFVPLPEAPMPKRTYDQRLGYSDPVKMAYEMDERTKPSTLPILRWRLQVGGPSKITMYVDPTAPRRWVPRMIKGIESWEPALAAAGWSDAIQVIDAAEIAGWSFDDVRHSAICWGVRQGCGWSIFDPRSGEILQYQIPGPEVIGPYALARYVVTMAAVDPRILSQPRSDEVLGDFIQLTSAHEMGHVLGLRDGNFGMGAYSLEQVRSPDWVREHGFTPSIINYTRFNYVWQPEDHFTPEMVIPGIGAGDVHAIRRGYESRQGVSESDATKYWLAEQAANPAYRYRRKSIPYLTPSEIEEAVGTTNLIEEARLGVRNLERSMAVIGDQRIFPDDDEVAEWLKPARLYEAAVEQWVYMVKPVLSLVGGYQPRPGVDPVLGFANLDPAQVQPVPAKTQREAMDYVCANAFIAPPRFLVEGPLLQRAGVTRQQAEEKLREVRARMLDDPLLHPIRMQRLMEEEGIDSEFGMLDFVRSLRACILPSGGS